MFDVANVTTAKWIRTHLLTLMAFRQGLTPDVQRSIGEKIVRSNRAILDGGGHFGLNRLS